MKTWVIWLSVIGLFVSTQTFSSTPGCEQAYCVAVVDAGSTGSRLHVYSYDLDATNTPIKITERWSKKITPGFATINPNKPSVDSYLSILFSGAPGHHYPVYFYATAGMRLLPQAKQQNLYALVDDWFSDNQAWSLQEAKTITGSEEGVFGWLSVNYQLDGLSKEEHQVGVLDTGGASVQVSFPVKNTEGVNPDDIRDVSVYGRKISLFVHSFLGLGETEVTHQFLDEKACFVNQYPLPSGLMAEGNAQRCEDSVAKLTRVHRVNEIVEPVLKANVIQKWYSLGAVVDLAKSEPFAPSEALFSPESLFDRGDKEICRRNWSDLKSQYPGEEYLYGYCLYSSYFYALIVDGYGIKPEESIHYFDDQQSGDWTLGVLLQNN